MIVCEPPDRLAVVKLAIPPEPSDTGPASVEAPSLNVTDPIGVPLPGGTDSVAVNVTVWPNVLGLGVECSDVEVASLFTVWVVLLELPANVPSPG